MSAQTVRIRPTAHGWRAFDLDGNVLQNVPANPNYDALRDRLTADGYAVLHP